MGRREEEGFAGSEMFVVSVKPFFSVLLVTLSLSLAVLLLSPPSSLFSATSFSFTNERSYTDIWSVRRIVEWRPCKWWLQGHLPDFLLKCCSSAC